MLARQLINHILDRCLSTKSISSHEFPHKSYVAMCCNLLLLYLYKPCGNILCLGQILLYALADVCHLINLQCLINLVLKDRFWSGGVFKHTGRESPGKEEENSRFFIVSLLPTHRGKMQRIKHM